MILGDNPADKTQETVTAVHRIIQHIDQADLIVQFEHVLGTLVQIDDAPFYVFDFVIHFIQLVFSFALPLLAYD